ncbi:MAG: hypothetical protein ACK53Y_18365, partial [bacterium]
VGANQIILSLADVKYRGTYFYGRLSAFEVFKYALSLMGVSLGWRACAPLPFPFSCHFLSM